MASKLTRIAKSISKAGGGDDLDAPPVHLPAYHTRPLFATTRTAVPTAKTDTAMGLVLTARDVVERSRP